MRGPTRRAALAGSLAGLLGAACGAPRPARQIDGGFVDDGVGAGHRFRDGGLVGAGARAERRARVVVVGGGVAGLAAAWRLERAGVEGVQVLELAPEAGGTSRAGSMELPGGERLGCPFGAHYLPLPRAEQRALAALLGDLGIADGVGTDGRVRVPDAALIRDPAERVAGLGGYFEEGLWLEAGADQRDADELARFEALVREAIAVDGEGRRLFDLPLARSSPHRRSLDGMSAAAWAKGHGLGGERIRWYLEYATRDDFGARLEDTSAWALLHYFSCRAEIATGESAPFLSWPEGNGRLVRGMEQRLSAPVSTGSVALAARSAADDVEIEAFDLQSGQPILWRADAAVLATPQYVTRRLLREDPAAEARASMRYGPWLVANLQLDRLPLNRGFPFAWDSVIHGSRSLGYVDAGHQLDRRDERGTVWTWYLPITDPDERGARRALLETPWEHWRDAVLADLGRCHPDIADVVRRIDVWRWGHGMIKPTPGLIWGGAREAAARPLGRLHFAHSDLSGVALFEEAHWQGVRAAEEVMDDLGVEGESLL